VVWASPRSRWTVSHTSATDASPVSQRILKIAKPFVEEVALGAERAALARAIIGLSDTLRLQTVAEGIEIAEQRATLIELGCPLGQGHHFARALPAEAIDRMLAGRRSLIPHVQHVASPKAALPRGVS
jgi:EAL domain-containing protein (putative c-di-GMP-specific phosphodiesterase class I)